MAAVIVVIALMAAVAVWLLLSDGADAGPPGQPQSAGAAPSEATSEAPASEPPSETASEPQSTATEETRAERLARLRKTDAFVEFANWDRARTAPNYERALGDFAWYDAARGSRVQFLNARQLWNRVSLPIRDDLLLQGAEHRGRFLDGRVSGGVTAVFERSNQQPQLVGFSALITAPDGQIRNRIHAALLEVDRERTSDTYGQGHLKVRMKPFSIETDGYDTTARLAAEGISPRVRAWANRWERR